MNKSLYWLEPDYCKDPFWDNICDEKINNRVIINGHHYTHNGISESPEKWRGMSGRHFTIKLNDGTIVHTNDLRHQGEIPLSYRKRLPDNAEFIND